MGCGVSSDSIENIILPINGQFEKKELIGVGSCGRVYRCVNQANNQQYAMKVIDNKSSQKAINREEQNFKVLISQSRQLHRDLIASYYDIQWKEKEIMIVMEFSKQGTLKKFIQQNGKLTEELISKITAQILEGMCYLHNAGIIHRDLKSSNVLYFPEQRIKLADYGLEDCIKIAPKNKKQKYKELDFSKGQSLRYSAPQIIKQEQPNYKTDIWSLGCIVIEMITGQAPWLNINSKFEAVFDSIIKQKAVILPKNISEQCKSFLNKCLQVSPQKRATTYELFSHPFVQRFISRQNNSIQQSKVQVKKTLEKSDIPNRMTPNRRDDAQFGKSPSSIQRNIKNDNSPISPQSYKLYQSQKFDSQNKKQYEGENQLQRLKQVVNNFGKIKKSKDKKSIYNDDILPQILEDEQHMVILNNKKVHLKNNQQKFKTQQSSTIAPRTQSSVVLEQNDSFLSINSNNRYRIKSRPHSNFNDSFQNESRIKLETEPILMTNDLQKDPQYFKKPLKLLKRKLKQKKNNKDINYHSGNQISLKEEDLNPNSRGVDKQAIIYSSKIRTISQQSNEQVVIHTQLAKAERDRYLRQQIFMKKQKQQQKRQWENELKNQSEVIKQQFAHRYAYKKFRPLLI